MKKIMLISLCLVSVISLLFALYRYGILQPNRPDKARYPVRGIDVSHHQRAIDWARLAADDVAYLKASEGGDHRDARFAENKDGASAAGIEVGAYHFFTLCRDGKAQAQNFLGLLVGESMALPPAIDLEYVGNCADRPSTEEFLSELGDFVLALSDAGYGKTVLYTTHEFYDDYLSGTPYALFPLWMRDVWREPDANRYPSMTLWQYADHARIDGIDGPVDLNAARAKN